MINDGCRGNNSFPTAGSAGWFGVQYLNPDQLPLRCLVKPGPELIRHKIPPEDIVTVYQKNIIVNKKF